MLASRWSSEHVVAAEYRDLQTNAMAVDCVGRFALLASKRCIALVDLEDPEQRIGRISRTSKWEVTSAMWNPHQSHAEYFVTASNQKVDLYRWHDYAELKQENSGTQFKAHTRVISDLDWSSTDPNYFATSSVDTFIFLWDIRDSRRPALSLSAVAGASQVKWNKCSGDILATSHDGDLRIWDQRKGTTPVNYITAHLAKIHGLDWSPNSELQLATSSQDCTVKFWDLSNPKRAEKQLTTGSPVWRARYTPFGSGLITVVVPQLRRGENSLLLWNIESLQRPVHTFVGHSDVILEFQWRRLPRDDAEFYQLVTWSKDQSLRIWKIDPNLQQIVGRDLDDEEEEEEGEEEEEEEEEGEGRTGSAEEKDEDLPQLEKKGSDDRLSNLENMSEIDIIETEEIKSLEEMASFAAPSSDAAPMDKKTSTSKESVATSKENLVTPGPVSSRKHKMSDVTQPRTLQQEFELLNKDIPNVSVHDMSSQNRKCRISATKGDTGIDIDVAFPAQYPAKKAPSFDVLKAKNMNSNVQSRIVQAMKDKSLQHVKMSQSCLEPCMRQLRDTMDEVQLGTNLEEENYGSPMKDTDNFANGATSREASLGPVGATSMTGNATSRNEYPYGLSPDVDASVPFPRTSGARFCGSFLVVFQRSSKQSLAFKHGLSSAELTPRSLTALAAYANLRHSTQNPSAGTQFSQGIYNLGRSPPTDVTQYSTIYKQHRKGSLRPRGKARKPVGIERHSTGEVKEGIMTSSSAGCQGSASSSQHPGAAPGIHWRSSDIPSIEVFDVSCLFPFSRELASKYIIDTKDLAKMCEANAASAAALGRNDLAQLWSLVGLMSTSGNFSGNNYLHEHAPWAAHPFGLQLVDSLVQHLVSQRDFQTLSMISCAFYGMMTETVAGMSGVERRGPSTPGLSGDESSTNTNGSNVHTYQRNGTWNQSSMNAQNISVGSGANSGSLTSNSRFIKRSSSWCDVTYEPPETAVPAEPSNNQSSSQTAFFNASPYLDTEFLQQCDKFQAAYSELLFAWKLLVCRCELLKCTSSSPEPHVGLELAPLCSHCDTQESTLGRVESSHGTSGDALTPGRTRASLNCAKCKRGRLSCAICRLYVKGLSMFCPLCSHGGHSNHMASWFAAHNMCPTGCGCQCLKTLDQPSSKTSSSSVSSSSSLKREADELNTAAATSTVAYAAANDLWRHY